MKTNICLLLLILVASNQALSYPSMQELTQELVVSGVEVSACIAKKHVANTASDALNGIKNFFGMRRRLLSYSEIAKGMAKVALKKGLVVGCTETAFKLLEMKIKPVVGEDIWKSAGKQCARDLVVTKCTAQVNKVVGRRLVAIPSMKEITDGLIMSGEELAACIAIKHVKNSNSEGLNAIKNFFSLSIVGRRLMSWTEIAKATAQATLKKGLVEGCTETAFKVIENQVKPVVGEDVWKSAGNVCARGLVIYKCEAQVNKVVGRRLVAIPSMKDLTQELFMSGTEMTTCITKKTVANTASNVKNGIANTASGVANGVANTATGALNGVKNFFGMGRRLLSWTEIAQATAKTALKKGLVVGCTETAFKLLEEKVKPVVGEDIWKSAGNQCARDLVVPKCEAQVNKVVGRRLVGKAQIKHRRAD